MSAQAVQTTQIAFLFPGQGSQYVGMGSDLIQDFPVAKKLFAQANEIVGYDLTALCLNGPEDDLKRTRYTQPALLTHSLACWTIFQELTEGRIRPALTAGHSLGEYCALVAAGALDFETALRLVQKRGEYMGTYGEGEMLAFPLHRENIQPLADKHYCAVAALNLSDQTVIGGRSEDLDRLTEDAQVHFPRKRPTRLKTEGAFHTFYMINAAVHFREDLYHAAIHVPHCRVLSNYSGTHHESDPDTIKARLFSQLFHPVRWISNLCTLFQDGITTVVEFGGGLGSGATPQEKRPTLEAMVKKALRESDYTGVHHHAAINSVTLKEAAAALRR